MQLTLDATAALPRRPSTIPFLFGRLDRRGRQLVCLRPRSVPFPGPWDLRAVVSGAPARS
jgi:hypothetical protein